MLISSVLVTVNSILDAMEQIASPHPELKDDPKINQQANNNVADNVPVTPPLKNNLPHLEAIKEVPTLKVDPQPMESVTPPTPSESLPTTTAAPMEVPTIPPPKPMEQQLPHMTLDPYMHMGDLPTTTPPPIAELPTTVLPPVAEIPTNLPVEIPSPTTPEPASVELPVTPPPPAEVATTPAPVEVSPPITATTIPPVVEAEGTTTTEAPKPIQEPPPGPATSVLAEEVRERRALEEVSYFFICKNRS